METMFRSCYIATLVLVSQLCLAQDLTREQLIAGTNQARYTVESGEMRVIKTVDYAAEKSDEEIQVWLGKEREAILEEFSHPDQAVEKEYALEELHFAAKRLFGERREIEESTIAFQILHHGSLYPENFQYKMNLIDRRGLDLHSKAGEHLYADYYQILTYDDEIQAFEYVFPNPSIMFASRNRYAGYLHFQLFGRSLNRVLPNAKIIGKETVGGADCYILEFQPETISITNLVRLWVDPKKHFCVRKEYREQQNYKSDGHVDNLPRIWELTYKDFREHEGIWYPAIAQWVVRVGERVENRKTISVKEFQINLSFADNFFQVSPRGHLTQGLRVLEVSGTNPKLRAIVEPPEPAPNSVDPDLLTCGPDSLLRICQLLNIDTDFDELSKLTGYDPEIGTNMLGLLQGAESKNLNPKGIKTNVKGLKQIFMPAIAYLKGNHFLVFEKAVSDGVLIFDPAEKYDRYLSSKELSQIWNGELLIFDYNLNKIKPELGTNVVIEKSLHDFGERLAGSKIKHNFELKNTGSDVLNILKVEVPCACTATLLSKDKILPGESGIIEAVFTVPSSGSQIKESFYIYTDDPVQSKIPLTFKGTAFLPISTFPNRVSFGKVTSPIAQKKTLTVHRAKGKIVHITGVRVNSPHLMAKIVSEAENEITRIDIEMQKTMPVAQFVHRLSIDYSYEGEEGTHGVTVSGEVLGEFTVSLKHLFFGLVKGTVTKTAQISSVDDHPFKITSVQSNSAYLTVTVNRQPDQMGYRLNATVLPQAPAGELSGEILMKTNSTIQPTIRVTFSGIISTESEIALKQ